MPLSKEDEIDAAYGNGVLNNAINIGIYMHPPSVPENEMRMPQIKIKTVAIIFLTSNLCKIGS